MYQIKINPQPELRIGDKIYTINNKLSTFRQILKSLSNGANEMETVLALALGEAAFAEIVAQDLPYATMQEIVINILAAIQDMPVEEAKRRFYHG